MSTPGRFPAFRVFFATFFLVSCLASSPVLAGKGQGTRDLVFEGDEPGAAAKRPSDPNLGPGPFFSFNKKQLDIVQKTVDQAEALRKKGQTRQALELVAEVEEQLKQLPQPPGPGIGWLVQRQRAFALNALGREAEAAQATRNVLLLAEKKFGADSDEALEARYNLGKTLNALGRMQDALTLQEDVYRTRVKKLGPGHEWTVSSGVDLAATLKDLGRYDEALALDAALLGAALKKHPPEADAVLRVRYTLAQTLEAVGDYDAAEKEVRELLAVMNKAKKTDEDRYFNSLSLLAAIVSNGPKGDQVQAAKLLDQVRQTVEQKVGPDHPATLFAALNSIRAQARLKNYDSAVNRLQALLPKLSKAFGEDHPVYLGARLDLGDLLRDRGDADGSVAVLQEVLPAAQACSDRQLPIRVAGALCKSYQVKGDLASAVFFGSQAVEAGQKLRRERTSPALQKSLAERLSYEYQALTDALLAQGRTAEAQKVLALMKENELGSLTLDAPAPAKAARGEQPPAAPAVPAAAGADARKTGLLASLDPKVASRYDAISDKIEALGKEQRDLLDKRAQGKSLSAQEEERLKTLREDMSTARKAFTAFLKDLSNELGQGDKRTADLAALETYQRLLSSLGEGVVLLQTVVTDSRIWLILTTPTSQVAKQSPFDVKQLPEKVAAFRDMLQDPAKDSRPLAKEFHDAVVGPLASTLEQAGAKQIMFSLDGQLRYIPMAALYDGERWLIQKYTVSLFNEATKAGLAVPAVGNWKVAGLGVTKEHKYGRGKFTALPAVKDELESIVRGQAGANGVLEGIMTLDEGFTAGKLQEVLETGYPVIHLASHFHFDKKNPETSFLLLGDGSGLALTQIESEDFKFKNVDLLALSACQTARGGVDATGKEIEGFGALAQKRGAKAVLATLWPVFDESTGLLMADFYRLHADKDKPSIAMALRQAQLRMIDNTIEGKDFRQPFYWAPFVLMGDWR